MSDYADTSFLFSLYAPDTNSARAAANIEQAHLPILLTLLAELEFTNALHLRLFRKELLSEELEQAHAGFNRDIADGIFQRIPLTPAIFDAAKRIARERTPRLGTRTLDVLHVAAALVLQADAFYTFDRKQARLARAEGLAVRSLG